MAVNKIDPKVIFASTAPTQDTPAVFPNKTNGWGESRKNGGRPTIKQMNALQQETDLKILWLNENAVTPYDVTIDYPNNAVTIKDGTFKILDAGVWKDFISKDVVSKLKTIPTYYSAVDGVDPIIGVADGAYFNVRSSNNESYVDEYQNVGGVAVVTGKRYLSALGVQQQDKPADTIKDASGKSQQEVNDLLSYATYKTPRQFGGNPDDPAYDNRYALQAAVDSDEPIFLDGLYYTTQAPVITKLKTIAGVNQETAGIVKVGNALSGLSSVAIDSNSTHNDIYNVDAILIVRGNAHDSGKSLYIQGLDFKNFRLDRHNYTKPATNDNVFGFYAPRLARSSFESFYVDNKDFGTGVRSFNIWMCKWSRCESKAYDTWHFGASRDQPYPYDAAGTSNMMLDCWSRDPKNFAYQFIGVQYSSAMNLACDYGGTEANPMQYVYYVSGTTNMTFINCAAEHIHGRLIWVSPNSRTVFIDPDFYTGIYGRKGNAGALIRVNNSQFKMINGRINLTPDSDSAYLQVSGTSKVSIENLQTNIEISGVERADASTLSTADKSKIYISGGYVEFKDGANTIEHDYGTNKTKLETPTLTTQNKTNQVTGLGNNFLTGGTWNASKFGLGAGRLWRSYHKLYYKREGEPTFENDGYLVNVHLGSGLFANAPVNNVDTLPLDAGQYYYCTQTNQPMFWSGTKYVNATGGNASATKPTITGLKTPTTLSEQVAVNNSIVAALVTLGLVIDSRT